MADALLTINNVVKRFDDTTILDGISFSVKKSEVIVIVGPSGWKVNSPALYKRT